MIRDFNITDYRFRQGACWAMLRCLPNVNLVSGEINELMYSELGEHEFCEKAIELIKRSIQNFNDRRGTR